MKKIAFFDFDGTITRADTMLEIFKFHAGMGRFIIGMLANSFYFLAMKFGWIDRQTAKEKLLTLFFGGLSQDTFDGICRTFSEQRLPSLIRPSAMAEIQKLRQSGFAIVVVTASPSDWVKYWTGPLDVDLISSKMEIQNGKVTGKLEGVNCNYQEKVIRIRQYFDLTEFETVHAYGDSNGDKAMLALATQPFYRSFN